MADARILQDLLEHGAPRSRRLERLLDPRLAWGQAPVDPAPPIGEPAGVAFDT